MSDTVPNQQDVLTYPCMACTALRQRCDRGNPCLPCKDFGTRCKRRTGTVCGRCSNKHLQCDYNFPCRACIAAEQECVPGARLPCVRCVQCRKSASYCDNADGWPCERCVRSGLGCDTEFEFNGRKGSCLTCQDKHQDQRQRKKSRTRCTQCRVVQGVELSVAHGQ